MRLQLSTANIPTRIQRAYVRKRSWWPSVFSFGTVWDAAAESLITASRHNRRIPVDPELYVSAQPITEYVADPWSELVGESAELRYVKHVNRIIRRLRREVRQELQRIRSRAKDGRGIEWVLRHESCQVSSIACYIAAVRAGRFEIAEEFRASAEQQHRNCPLYQPATECLIDEEEYPTDQRPYWFLNQSRFSGDAFILN